MRGLLLAAVFFVSLSTTASDLPVYLGEVRGTLLTGLTSRDTLHAWPGEVGKCKRSDAMDLVVYVCEVTKAGATVTGSGPSRLVLSFDKLVVMFKSQKSGDVVREYIFRGSWRDETQKIALHSKVEMTLWNYRSSPRDIRGWVSLDDYGIRGSVQAVQERTE